MTAHFAAAALFAAMGAVFVFTLRKNEISRPHIVMAAVCIAAFAVRSYLAFQDYAFWFDIGCFKNWGQQALQSGLSGLYHSGIFLDYPPGYMYVLAFTRKLRQILGAGWSDIVYTYLIKLFPILADIAGGILVYKIALRRGGTFAVYCAAFYLFRPAMLFNSAVWGQIDSYYTLLVVLALYLIYCEKDVAASIVYALALLTKPQALLFGPVFLFYVLEKKSVKRLVKTVGTGLARMWALSAPFAGSGGVGWLINLYTNTFNGYRYFSVNGYNLYALLDLNWMPLDRYPGSEMINVAVITCCVIICAAVYFRQKDRNKIFFTAYILITVFFTFCTMMHERYMLPAVLLSMVLFALTGRKRYFGLFIGASTLSFLNIAASMQSQYGGYYVSRRLYKGVGFATVLLCAAGTAIFLCGAKGIVADFAGKKRRLYTVGALTVLYALRVFFRLGSSRAPQTFYQSTYDGQWFVIRFEKTENVRGIYSYSCLGDAYFPRGDVSAKTGCNFNLLIPDENGLWQQAAALDNEYVFTWEMQETDFECDRIMVRSGGAGQVLGELVLTDAEGQIIRGYIENGGDFIYRQYSPYLALDESHMLPSTGDMYYWGMYFDEIYHRRSAYEQLAGYPVYENTHPPLGKMLISIGIALFGMTPFGWRFAGAVRGVIAVPVMWLTARRLLKNQFAAFVCTFLFAFDFMHYTQSRIATVDIFLLLFIMLMFLFMAQFAAIRPGQEKEKQLVCLFFSGLFMGCAIAVKWSGVWAAAGLAVYFFAVLVRRYKRIKLLSGAEKRRKSCAALCLWCVVFFVIIPFVVYFASFAPVFESRGAKNIIAEFISRQKAMFDYHSTLEATHFFSSEWYSWPFNIKPVWYSVSRYGTLVSSISCMGNIILRPLIPFAVIYTRIRSVRVRDIAGVCVTGGYLACLLPWAFVGRISFIYHYLPCIFFGLMAVGFCAKKLLESRGRKALAAVLVLCCAALAAFVLYFPVISGVSAPGAYIDRLELLPSWYFN